MAVLGAATGVLPAPVVLALVTVLLLGWIAAMLVLLPPSIYVAVRRLHDTGRSGTWWLLSFVPVVGSLVLLALACLEGTPGPNRYGPSAGATAVAPSPQVMRVHPAFAPWS